MKETVIFTSASISQSFAWSFQLSRLPLFRTLLLDHWNLHVCQRFTLFSLDHWNFYICQCFTFFNVIISTFTSASVSHFFTWPFQFSRLPLFHTFLRGHFNLHVCQYFKVFCLTVSTFSLPVFHSLLLNHFNLSSASVSHSFCLSIVTFPNKHYYLCPEHHGRSANCFSTAATANILRELARNCSWFNGTQ